MRIFCRFFTMNDVVQVPAGTRKPVVRPRDAASLILLRGEGQDLEVLAGRRPLHVKFMPGVHVFPGGAIDPPDRIAWSLESGSDALGPRLARSARAALRETWEEVGVLVGRPAGIALCSAGHQADRTSLSRTRPRRGIGPADLCRAGDHPVSLEPALQYPVFPQRRRQCVRRTGVERRTRGCPLVPGRATSARIVSRCDAVHAGPGDRFARRHRQGRDAAVLLGQERAPHRRLPRKQPRT